MKICILTDGVYPFSVGGMQKHISYIIHRFANTDHEVNVFMPEVDQHTPESAHISFFGPDTAANIRFTFIPNPKPGKFPGQYIWWSWQYARNITLALQEFIPGLDVIYSKGFCAWHYLLHRPVKSVPVISQLHGLEMYQKSWSFSEWLKKMILRLPASAILRKSDYMFSYGGKVKEIALRLGVRHDRIFTQYGAADRNFLYPSPDPKPNNLPRQFLYVARFEFRKGYHVMISALKNLNPADYHLTIVGDVPEENKLLQANILYTGNLPAETILKHMEKAEVLLLPSLSEGFPTILVEAMARGLSPIATDVGAVADIVDHTVGWLIPAGDITALRDAMHAAITCPSQTLQSQQKLCVDRVHAKFNWENTFPELVSHLQFITHDYRNRTTG
ncbi:MAG: glycosyltransferase family 4 protein [Bacteroidetes bacterium]|nr:glycosyltransferase family 4 protein [Bacteroidota bacterium]